VFGLGKTKIPLNDLADILAKNVLRPLEDPSEQDLMFRKQAEQVGVEPKRFTFEVIAIQLFATGAAINRERLEGRMTMETATALTKESLRATHRRLENTTNYDLLELGFDPEEAFDLMMERLERYSQPLWRNGSIRDVYRFFAEFCGFPESDVLERIGWSLTQVRGDEMGEFLMRRVKIV
jgi:hypothetical protein